jgi:hypothetical protein
VEGYLSEEIEAPEKVKEENQSKKMSRSKRNGNVRKK